MKSARIHVQSVQIYVQSAQIHVQSAQNVHAILVISSYANEDL